MLGGMTPPADAVAPAPAQREADSTWGMKFALGVVGFMMLAMFVFPGFLAAGFSRGGSIIFSGHGKGRMFWGGFALVSRVPPSPFERAGLAILAPSNWLMEHSHSILLFYMWQYRIGGGISHIWNV
jgi:hypothetical protein